MNNDGTYDVDFEDELPPPFYTRFADCLFDLHPCISNLARHLEFKSFLYDYWLEQSKFEYQLLQGLSEDSLESEEHGLRCRELCRKLHACTADEVFALSRIKNYFCRPW